MPPLVLPSSFLHGELRLTQLAALTNEYDVIIVDARGQGLVEPPASGFGQAKHAVNLAA